MDHLERVDFTRITDELLCLILSAESPVLVYDQHVDEAGKVSGEPYLHEACAQAAFQKLVEGVKRVRAVMPDDLQLADCGPVERSDLRRLAERVDEFEQVWIIHNSQKTLEFSVCDQDVAILRDSLKRLQLSRDDFKQEAPKQPNWPEQSPPDNTKVSTTSAGSQKRQKRSVANGNVAAKILGGLNAHHKYDNGSCSNLEPIKLNQFASKNGVSSGALSKYFKDNFGGHSKYAITCHDNGLLAASLKMLNGEFTPKIFFKSLSDDDGNLADE